MLYSEWITKMRREVGDTHRSFHNVWSGNGSDTLFLCPEDTFPILDQTATYVVKVGGSTMTETTDYVLDKDTGRLLFTSAPANGTDNVTLDGRAVHLTDAAWITIHGDVIRSLGDDFWKEFTDTTSFTATSGMTSLSLVASQPKCIAVSGFDARTSTSDEWRQVAGERCNWRYDRDNNVIYIGLRTAFSVTGELLRVRGLKSYIIYTDVAETIDVQDKYTTVIEYGAKARYWGYRYKDVVELVSKMSTEQSRTPLQELIMLKDRFTREFDAERARLKPQKPSWRLPTYMPGGGQP